MAPRDIWKRGLRGSGLLWAIRRVGGVGVGGCGTAGAEGCGGVFGGGGGESAYDLAGAGGAVLLGVGACDDAWVGGVGWGGEVGGSCD